MITETQKQDLRNLLDEVHGEILDDCGDWEMPVDASEIVDCAIEGDWCDSAEFRRIGASREEAMKIALTLKNVLNR